MVSGEQPSAQSPDVRGAAVGAFLVATLLYLPTLRYGFVFDDLSLIGPKGPVAVGGFFPYRPLRWLSYCLDWALGAGAPWVFHATNVAFHAVNAALVAVVASRFAGSALVAFVAAALFAVHPLTVEPVAYVAGRRDLLATFFGLVAMWFVTMRNSRPRTALVCVVVGVAAKESALLFLPGIAWLGIRRGEGGVSALPVFVVAVAASVALMVGYGAIGPWWPQGGLVGVGRTLVHYAGALVWPLSLSAEYPRLLRDLAAPGEIQASLLFASWAAVAVLIGLPFGLSVAGAKAPADRLWVAIAMVAFGVGAIGAIHEPGADRHAYPLLAALAVGAASMLSSRLAVLGLVGVLVLAPVSLARSRVWISEAALWKDTVMTAPESLRARINWAGVLVGQGRPGKARRQLQVAKSIDPDDPLITLGYAALACGRGADDAVRLRLERARQGGAPVLIEERVGRDCGLPEYAATEGASEN